MRPCLITNVLYERGKLLNPKADAPGGQEWIVLLYGLQLKGSACPSEMITGVGLIYTHYYIDHFI